MKGALEFPNILLMPSRGLVSFSKVGQIIVLARKAIIIIIIIKSGYERGIGIS